MPLEPVRTLRLGRTKPRSLVPDLGQCSGFPPPVQHSNKNIFFFSFFLYKREDCDLDGTGLVFIADVWLGSDCMVWFDLVWFDSLWTG